MQGHEQHQMRRDPLHMYFVISMLCLLVAIRYLVSPANSESNKIQRDKATSSGMERTCKHEQRHEDIKKRKAQAVKLETSVVEEEQADKEHFLKMRFYVDDYE
ncbi:hypothetical protein BD560DRAFT_428335 [Blakeslea trispora]|nr:hypothetical protein BD560DRAFT_428335 [Blakeslea trispora]